MENGLCFLENMLHSIVAYCKHIIFYYFCSERKVFVMKIDSLYIDNYKLLNDFRIDFKNGDSYNPITVITGINGSGKTSVLEYIYSGLFGHVKPSFGKSYLMVKNDSNVFDEERYDKNTIIKWLLWNNVNRVNPHTGLSMPNTDLISENLRKTVVFYKACEGNTNAEIFIKEYVDKLIYEEDIVSSEAYSKIRDVVNDIFGELNMQIEFDRMDKDKNVYFRNFQYNNITLKDLSGGERTILTKILPLYLHDYKDGIILIDEPEISLHPNWQFQIIELYKKIAIRNNNQFIIATHSPQIVASVEQESLRVLVRENDKIRVVDSDSNPNPFGKRLDEVLLEIFQMNGLRTPSVEKKIDQLKQLLSDNKYDTNEFVSTYNEVKELLGNSDSDLLLINLELARKKRMNEKNN